MRISRAAYVACVLASLLGLSTIGCVRSNRLPIAGRATVDGKSVDQGLLVFEPTAADCSASGAIIRNSEFSLAESHGLKPGKYLVKLTALRRTGRKIADPQGVAPVDELVPIAVDGEIEPITISAENSQRLVLDFTAVD